MRTPNRRTISVLLVAVALVVATGPALGLANGADASAQTEGDQTGDEATNATDTGEQETTANDTAPANETATTTGQQTNQSQQARVTIDRITIDRISTDHYTMENVTIEGLTMTVSAAEQMFGEMPADADGVTIDNETGDDGMANETEDGVDVGNETDDGLDNETDNATVDNETDDGVVIGNETDDGTANETDNVTDNDTAVDNETDGGVIIGNESDDGLDNETDNDTAVDNETDGAAEDNQTLQEEPEGESFEVTNLEAPETATVGDQINVSAEISNPNEFSSNQSVEFRLDGDVVERQYVTLDAEENRTVTFEVDTEDLEAGEYNHGILTFDRGEVAEITLESAEEDEDDAADDEGVAADDDEDDAATNATLEVQDQSGDGETLDIDEASADEDYYIVARYDDETSESETFIGVEERFDYSLTLDPPIESDTSVEVALLSVDDDEELASEEIDYDVQDDDGATDEDGAADEEDATDDEDDDAQPSASVTFEDQETDGSTVTVDSVNVSEGGFVTIHDSSLLVGETLGSVIGTSEYLEPGEHEDVEVELYDEDAVPGAEFDQDALERDENLIAMPHLDTNDNESYDFVETEGEDDGPYTEDGEAVTDEAVITVDGDDGAADNETTAEDGEATDNETADNETTAEENGTTDNETGDNETTDGDATGVADNETA